VAEHSVEIALEEGSEDGEKVVLRGKIDILLLYRHLWVAVIEAKQKRFNLLEALPQTLAYLLSNPDATGSQFALLANGTEFLFVKLLRKELPQSPQYSFSRLFSLWNPGNELDHVVGILRHLGQEVVNLGANGYREWGNAET
jgi:type I site-specific restriction endonuclease